MRSPSEVSGLPEPLETIFNYVCVCRFFVLDSLNKIFNGMPPVDLIWNIGDLSASGYLQPSNSIYIVVHNKALEYYGQRMINFSYRHEEWKNFHLAEFENQRKIENLAELLYHEVQLSLLKNPGTNESQLIEHLRAKANEYLFSIKKSFSESEYQQRKQELIERLKNEKLNRINQMLSQLIEFLENAD